MTRLNSTFRSGCKLDNRTIKREKQAEQAYRLRKNPRSGSKQSGVILYFDKPLIRTGRLFGTRLHERSTRTKSTSEIKVRGMDVARQSNMEDGLQVKLLPWKDKPGKLSAGGSADYKPYEDDSILHNVSSDFCRYGPNEQKQGQHRSYKKPKECVEQLNGERRIEAGVKTDNRTNLDALTLKETLQHSDINELIEELSVGSTKVAEKKIQDPVPVRVRNNGEWNGHFLSGSKRTKTTEANQSCECQKSISCKEGRTSASRPSVLNLISPSSQSNLNIHRENVEDIELKNASSDILSNEGQHCHGNLNALHSDGDSLHLAQNSLAQLDSLVNNFEQKLIYSSQSTITENKEAEIAKSNIHAESCKYITTLPEENLKEESCYGRLVKDQESGVEESSLVKRPRRTNRGLKRNHDCDYITEMIPLKRKRIVRTDLVRGDNKKASKSSSTKGKQKNKNQTVSSQKVEADTEADDIVICKKEEETLDQSKYVNVEYVLGIRHNGTSNPQVLVQFMDETSNWIEVSEMHAPLSTVSEYFLCPSQDLSVLHRLPSSWFGESISSWKERKPLISDFVEYEIYDKHNSNVKNDNVFLFNEDRAETTSSLIKQHPQYSSTESLQFDEQLAEFPGSNDTFVGFTSEEETKCELATVRTKENQDPIKNNFMPDESSDEDTDLDCLDVHSHPLDSSVEQECRTAKRAYKEGSWISPETVPVFVSRNGELEVLEADHIEIVLKHKDKRSKRIRSETCDNLIQQLEKRIGDEKCKIVVIIGLEDYFSSTMDMEKLLKFPAESEKTKYDEKMANLRYLFQTLKHYPKPIIAVINSAASGLAAALLSLVDIVFDQSQEFSKKNGLCNGTPHVPILAPRLMGLQHKNEALLMGELPDQRLEEQLKQVNNIFRSYKFSDDITSTLKEMRVNESLSHERPSPKKRGRLLSSNKASPTMPLEASQNKYAKTRLSRLKFNTTAGEHECVEPVTDNELQEAIDREQELASKCLEDLAEFWKEVSDPACS